MSRFKDKGGEEWPIALDGFVLEEVAKRTGIDLADTASSGWLKFETDSGVTQRVLAVVCEDAIAERKLSPRNFAKAIRGKVFEQARAALREEAADFFPPSEWSAIQQNLKRRRESKDQAESLQTAMAALEGMSPEFQQGALEAMSDLMKEAATDSMRSANSQESKSASGQDATPSEPVSSEPEKSESAPED